MAAAKCAAGWKFPPCRRVGIHQKSLFGHFWGSEKGARWLSMVGSPAGRAARRRQRAVDRAVERRGCSPRRSPGPRGARWGRAFHFLRYFGGSDTPRRAGRRQELRGWNDMRGCGARPIGRIRASGHPAGSARAGEPKKSGDFPQMSGAGPGMGPPRRGRGAGRLPFMLIHRVIFAPFF